MFNQWCTIESDPGVFTDLIDQIGVPGVQVEELYNMEDTENLQRLKPIYGYIFLFKWVKDPELRNCLVEYDADLFFSNQIINNACATQAILAVVLNSPLKLRGAVKDFYEFAKQMSSQDKGIALSNSDPIRVIHNSFSRPEPFIFKEDKKSKKKQEAFHFVSYVPFKNTLYELDGLQKGPISLGPFEGDDWMPLAESEIKKRIQRYSDKEIRFTLLAVCQKLSTKSERQIQELQKQKLQILKQLQRIDPALPELSQIGQLKTKYPSEPESTESADKESLRAKLVDINGNIQLHTLTIQDETQKLQFQKKENVRRRHNYIPLILEMLKSAAVNGKLTELLENTKKK